MDCEAARKLVDDLLDGRLAAAREVELRGHASSCPECSAALGEADAFAAEMSASFRAAREAAPPDMPRRVMRAVASAGARGGVDMRPLRGRRIAWIGAAAAAVAAAVVVAISLPGNDPEADPVAGGRATAPVHDAAAAPRVEVATLAAGRLEARRAGSDEAAALEAGAPLAAGDAVRASGEEPCELVLADGSRVYLKPGAEAVLAPSGGGTFDKLSGAVLSGSKGGGARTLRLDAGSVFVEVEKDAEPFVVATALGDVTTLGTKFGVSLDSREGGEAGEGGEGGEGGETELVVAVEEGAVRVDGAAGGRVVRAGEGCVYGGGERACGMSGEQCRGRFGWMERHREHCRRGRAHGEGGPGRRPRGDGHGPEGRGQGQLGGEMRRGESGHGAGSGRRSGDGQGAGEGRRLDAGPGAAERLRAEEQRRTEERNRTEERRRTEERNRTEERARTEARERAEGRRRAEEKKRTEEKKRVEEERRAEEEKRAEEQRRIEEERKEEQRRRDEAGQGGGQGGGGRGSGGGGRGRRGR